MDIELVTRKAAQAGRALDRIRRKLPAAADSFERDHDAQDTVYWNLIIAAQNCVDIAAHVIAENAWESPDKMGAVFDILANHGRIPQNLAGDLHRLVTLRNIIVHDYARIDLERAFPLLQSSLNLVPAFCRAILKVRK